MEAYPEYTFKIMHTTQNQYYIQNVETEKYLAVTFKTAGKKQKKEVSESMLFAGRSSRTRLMDCSSYSG